MLRRLLCWLFGNRIARFVHGTRIGWCCMRCPWTRGRDVRRGAGPSMSVDDA